MNNKYPISRILPPRERLCKTASLLVVAIARLHSREREKFSKDSLDSDLKQSVNTPSTKY